MKGKDDNMINIVDIEVLPLQTVGEAIPWVSACRDRPDYPRWFWYRGQLYSLKLMFRCNAPGWDFKIITAESNGTVYAAVLDERTVRVGRMPHGAGTTEREQDE